MPWRMIASQLLPRAIQRFLAFHVERKTQSEIVEALITRHLGGYYVGKRGDGYAAEAGQGGTE